jgi:hypothetical protein
MLKKITFSVDSDLIEKARSKAISNHSTLEEEFLHWLEQYTRTPDSDLRELLSKMDYVRVGRHFSRDKMNKR